MIYFKFLEMQNNYTLSENTGITSVTFVGSARTVTSDVGISNFPKGGIIVSVGSKAGLGYQPLVSAGGTAVVSVAGTITSISIGNSGSGYRSGIQTSVSVGVKLPDVINSTITPIGIASVFRWSYYWSGSNKSSGFLCTKRHIKCWL